MVAVHFVFVLVLFSFAFGGSHGRMTKEELHWKSVFSHTRMPKVLQQILPTLENKRVSVEPEIGVFDSYGFDRYDLFSYKEVKTEDIDQISKGANDNWNEDNSVKKLKNKDSSEKKGVNVEPEIGVFDSYGFHSYDLFSYKEVKTEDTGLIREVGRKGLGGKKTIKETIFFFQENLLPGTKVNSPRLIQKRDMAAFLPRQIAESMPFSSEEIPQILKNFSFKAESKGATVVKKAVRNCERSTIKRVRKYCATSLESFVDLGVSTLEKNIKSLSHDLGEDMKTPFFTIGQGIRKMGENNIVCHKMKCPYAVYLCHSIEKTEVYKVLLVSDDGTKVKAMVACHKDTSAWSPNHIAFKLLKVKPGTVPICHFLGRTLVWIPYYVV